MPHMRDTYATYGKSERTRLRLRRLVHRHARAGADHDVGQLVHLALLVRHGAHELLLLVLERRVLVLQRLHLVDHVADLEVLLAARRRVAQLLLEVVDLFFVLAQHRLVVQHLIHLGCVFDGFCARGKLEGRKGLLGMHDSIGHSADNRGAGVAAERTLEHARQLAVAVRDMRLLALRQLRDHVAEGEQALVDVGALLEAGAGGLRVRLALAAGEVDQIELRDAHGARGVRLVARFNHEPKQRVRPRALGVHLRLSHRAIFRARADQILCLLCVGDHGLGHAADEATALGVGVQLHVGLLRIEQVLDILVVDFDIGRPNEEIHLRAPLDFVEDVRDAQRHDTGRLFRPLHGVRLATASLAVDKNGSVLALKSRGNDALCTPLIYRSRLARAVKDVVKGKGLRARPRVVLGRHDVRAVDDAPGLLVLCIVLALIQGADTNRHTDVFRHLWRPHAPGVDVQCSLFAVCFAGGGASLQRCRF